MFLIKFEPPSCRAKTIPAEGENPERVIEPKFSGHVVLRVPSYDQRADLRDRVQNADRSMLNVALRVAKGELTQEQAADEILEKGPAAGLSITRTIVALVPQYVESVHIVRLADNYAYKSVDELFYDEGCGKLVEELGAALFLKVQIGPNGPELRQN